jgi:hypothetical protein
MSRACKEARRSSGGLHVVSEARNSCDCEHPDCARAVDHKSSGAATNRILVRRRGSREAFSERLRLAPNAREAGPIESRDVPLPLDARAE